MLANIILVALGASLGAVLRYMAVLFIPFYPVFVVNALGSLMIGYMAPKLSVHYPHLVPLLIVGFLGSLTTFSSFSLELFNFFSEEQFLKALVYAVMSVVVCFAMCWLGARIAMIG